MLFKAFATEKHKELQLPTETLREDIIKSFLSNLGSELSPVCAFVGGQLAQDVINVIGGKEQPIQNFVVFDGDVVKGPMYSLYTDMQQALASVNGNGIGAQSMPVANMPSTNGQTGNDLARNVGIGGNTRIVMDMAV